MTSAARSTPSAPARSSSASRRGVSLPAAEMAMTALSSASRTGTPVNAIAALVVLLVTFARECRDAGAVRQNPDPPSPQAMAAPLPRLRTQPDGDRRPAFPVKRCEKGHWPDAGHRKPRRRVRAADNETLAPARAPAARRYEAVE